MITGTMKARTADKPRPHLKLVNEVKRPAPKPALRSVCPINTVLEMVGDHWSLLILRDMMFKGHKSYHAFLKSEEKIATNILADRLTKLESYGLISKANDPSDARRFIYSLTEKGADFAPLLVEMTLYGAKHALVVDTPKDILESIKRNKSAFTQNLIKANAPKTKRPKKPEIVDEREETLSLFDEL